VKRPIASSLEKNSSCQVEKVSFRLNAQTSTLTTMIIISGLNLCNA